MTLLPDHPIPPALLERTVAQLCDFVSVASISARGERLDDGADHTAELLRQAGLEVRTWDSPGAPLVFAQRPAPAGAPTVLIYGHYDVQPADPLDLWRSSPFEASVRDGAVFGRGAGDNKGQLLAHIVAIAELIRGGDLGIGVKFLVEGEEEVGSPHIAAVAAAHRAELSADLAITADAPRHTDGAPLVIFGVRGLLYLELRLEGARSDLHSGNRGGVAPLPAWNLVHVLSSLRDASGRVLVPGFYDDVREPSVAERRLLSTTPVNPAQMARDMGLEKLATEQVWDALMFQPTFNLAGINSGYSGPGIKTIIPHRAGCKIDVRLVADQDPERIFAAIRSAIRAVDANASIDLLAAVPPSATPLDTSLAAPVIRAISQAHGRAPILRPRLSGTTPDYVFTRVLGIPSLLVPYGPPDMNHHAPNERMTLEALDMGVRCTIAICTELAAQGSGLAPAQ